MNRNIFKLTSIIMCIISILLFAFSTTVFAKDYKNFEDMGNVKLSEIQGEDNSGASASIGNMSAAIYNIVQVVSIFVAVIMLIVLAIKYISAAPNDKAEIKKHAVVYVVGAIILFGAAGIVGIIKNFSRINITQNNNNENVF